MKEADGPAGPRRLRFGYSDMRRPDRSFRTVITSDACTEMSEEMPIAALQAF